MLSSSVELANLDNIASIQNNSLVRKGIGNHDGNRTRILVAYPFMILSMVS